MFVNQYGRAYNSFQTISNFHFKKLLEKCKIDGKRLYDLRHSFASINLSKNRLPLLLVSKIMGHADPAVTLKEYTEYIADSEDETLDMINEAFKGF